MANMQQLRQFIYRYLDDNEPHSTTDIMDEYNRISKHGTTSQIIKNILGKDSNIEFVRYTLIPKQMQGAGSNRISVWRKKQ